MTDHNDEYNSIEALIAVGGNSRLALSLRARRQLRDRGGKDGGQFVYMGGGVKRALRRITAMFTDPATGEKSPRQFTGTVTQPGSGDKNIEVHVTPKQAKEAGIRPGFYDVDVNSSSEVEAILSEEALSRAGVKTAGPRVTTATPDFNSITRRDLPLGWKKGKQPNTYETEGGDFTYSVTPDGKGVVRDNLTGREQKVDDWVDAIAFANSSVLSDSGDKMPETREEAIALQNKADAEELAGVPAAKEKPEKTSAELADEIVKLEGQQQKLDPMAADFDKKDSALTKKIEAARKAYEKARDLEEKAAPKPVVKLGDQQQTRSTFDELKVGDVVLDENGKELLFLSADRKPDNTHVVSFQDAKGKTVEKTYGSETYTVPTPSTVTKIGAKGGPTWTVDNRKDLVKAEPTPNSIPKPVAKKPKTLPGDTGRTYSPQINVVTTEGDEVSPEMAQDIQKRLGKGSNGLQGNLFGVARQSATKERKAREAIPATPERLAEFLEIDDVDITDDDIAKLKSLEKLESFKNYNDRIAKAYFTGDKNVPLSKQELADIFAAMKSDIDALDFDSEVLKDYLDSELQFWTNKYKLPAPSKKPVATIPATTDATVKAPEVGDVVSAEQIPSLPGGAVTTVKIPKQNDVRFVKLDDADGGMYHRYEKENGEWVKKSSTSRETFVKYLAGSEGSRYEGVIKPDTITEDVTPSVAMDADAIAKRKAEITEENSKIVAELAKLRDAKEAAGGKLSAADQKKFDELSAKRSALLEEMNSFPKDDVEVEAFEFDLSTATPLEGSVRNAVSEAVDALPESLKTRYLSSNYRRTTTAPATAEDVAKEQEIYDEYVSTVAPFIVARMKARYEQEVADGNPDARKNYDDAAKELEDVLWQDISAPVYTDAATKLVGGEARAMMVSKSLANIRKYTVDEKPDTPAAPATPVTTGAQGKGTFDTSKLSPANAARAEAWLNKQVRYKGEVSTNRELLERLGIGTYSNPEGPLLEILDDGTQRRGKPVYGILIDPEKPNTFLDVPKIVHDAFVPGQADATPTPTSEDDDLLATDTSNMTYDEKVEFGQKLWDARATAVKEKQDKTAGVEFLRKLAEIDPDMAEYYKAIDKINEWKARPDVDDTPVQNAIAALQMHNQFEVWPTLLKRYVKGTDKLPVKGAPRAKSVVPERLLKDPVAKTTTPTTETATDELLSTDTSNMSYDEKVEFGKKLWAARLEASKKASDAGTSTADAMMPYYQKLAEIDPDVVEHLKLVDAMFKLKGLTDSKELPKTDDVVERGQTLRRLYNDQNNILGDRYSSEKPKSPLGKTGKPKKNMVTPEDLLDFSKLGTGKTTDTVEVETLEPGAKIDSIDTLNDAPFGTEIYWLSSETNLPVKKFVKLEDGGWHSLKEDGTPTAAKVPKKTLSDLVDSGNLEVPAVAEEREGDVTPDVAIKDLRTGDQVRLPNGQWAEVTKVIAKGPGENVVSLDNGLDFNTKTPIPGQPRSVDAIKAVTGFNSASSKGYVDTLSNYRSELLDILDQADSGDLDLNDRYRDKIDSTIQEIDSILEYHEENDIAVPESVFNMLMQGGTLTDVERMNSQYATADEDSKTAPSIYDSVSADLTLAIVDFINDLDEFDLENATTGEKDRAEYVAVLLERLDELVDLALEEAEQIEDSNDYATAQLAIEEFRDSMRREINKLARGESINEVGDEIDSFLDEIEGEAETETDVEVDETPETEEDVVEEPVVEDQVEEIAPDVADEIDSFLDEIEEEAEGDVTTEPDVVEVEEDVTADDTAAATEEEILSAQDEFNRGQSFDEFVQSFGKEQPESGISEEDFEVARQNIEEILQRDNFTQDDYDELAEGLEDMRKQLFGEDETPEAEPTEEVAEASQEEIDDTIDRARREQIDSASGPMSIYSYHLKEGDTIEGYEDAGPIVSVNHRKFSTQSGWVNTAPMVTRVADVTFADGSTASFMTEGRFTKRLNITRPSTPAITSEPAKRDKKESTKSAAREAWDKYEAEVLAQAAKRLPKTDVDVANGTATTSDVEADKSRQRIGVEQLKRAKNGDRVRMVVDGEESEWVKFNDMWYQIDADGNAIIENENGEHQGLTTEMLRRRSSDASTKGSFYGSDNSGVPENLTDYADSVAEAEAEEEADDSTVDSLNNKISKFNRRLAAIQEAESKVEDAIKYGLDRVPYKDPDQAETKDISFAELAALREQLYQDVAAVGGASLTDDQRNEITKKKMFLLSKIAEQKGKNKAEIERRKRPYEQQLELLKVLETGLIPSNTEDAETAEEGTEVEEEAPWYTDPEYAEEDLPRSPRVDFDAPLFQSKNVRKAIEEQQKIDEANRDLERIEKMVQGNFPGMTKVRQHEAYIDMLALRGEIVRRERRLARLKARMSQDEITTFSRIKSEPRYMPLKVQEAVKDFDMLKRDALELRAIRKDLTIAGEMRLETGGTPLIDFVELKKAEQALFERRAKLLEDIQKFQASMTPDEQDLFDRYMFQESIRLRKNDPDNYDDILRWSSPVMPCVPREMCGETFEGRRPVRVEGQEETANLADLQAEYLTRLDNVDDLNRQVRDIYEGLNSVDDANDETVERLRTLQQSLANERNALADLDERIARFKREQPAEMSEADQQELEQGSAINSTDDLMALAPGATIRITRGDVSFEFVRSNSNIWFPVDNEGNYAAMPMTAEDLFELGEIGIDGTTATILKPSGDVYPDLKDHRDGTNRLMLVNPEALDLADIGSTVVLTNSVDIDPENPNGEVERVSVARYVKAIGPKGEPQWFKISSRTGKRNQRPISASELAELKNQVNKRNVVLDDTDISMTQLRRGEGKKQELLNSLRERQAEIEREQYRAVPDSTDDGMSGYLTQQFYADKNYRLNQLQKAISEIESSSALEYESAKAEKNVKRKVTAEEITAATGVENPTDEQIEIINWFMEGNSGVVLARAGSGKTTTMRMLLQVANRRDVLYTSFASAVIEDGRTSLPRGTFIETLDALGFAANSMYRARYNRDLASKPSSDKAMKALPRRQAMSTRDITEFLQIGDAKFLKAAGRGSIPVKPDDIADRLLDTIEKFAEDEVDKITVDHLPDLILELRTPEGVTNEEYLNEFVKMAQKLWDERIALDHRVEVDDSPTGYSFVGEYNGREVREFLPLTNGILTKLWQMSGEITNMAPKIRREIGMLVVDEAQDLNKMQASIVDQMGDAGVQIVMVGDPNQSIFEWRGGTDQLDRFAAKFGKALPLSKTFRSGEVVTSAGNVILFLGGENVRTVSGRPEMAGKIRVSSMAGIDVDDLPDFLKGHVEVVNPEIFGAEPVYETDPETGDEVLVPHGFLSIDAMLTLENAPIINHLLVAASLGLSTAVNENFREDVLNTLDAFEILQYPPQHPIRLQRAGQLGLFSDDRGRLAELPFEGGVPGVPESSIMGWWRASRQKEEGEGGRQGPAVPGFPSQQLSTFLSILDKRNALPSITKEMTIKERDAEKERAARVREGIAEVVRNARPDTNEKETDQQALFVEELKFAKIALPTSSSELADMSITDREGDLIPGVVGYTIESYARSQTKFKLQLSGSTTALRAVAKRFRDAVERLNAQGLLTERGDKPSFLLASRDGQDTYIGNVDQQTLEMVLKEMAPKARLINPPEEGTFDEFKFPKDYQFVDESGEVTEPYESELYTSTARLVRDEFGYVSLNADGKPVVDQSEQKVSITVEGSPTGIAGRYLLTIRDPEAGRQRVKVPGTKDFVDIGNRDPISGDDMRALGFYRKYVTEVPVPGSKPKPTGRIVRQPIKSKDGKFVRDADNKVMYEEVPEMKQPVLYPAGEMWQFAGTEEQLTAVLGALRNGTEPGDALMDRFASDLLVATVFRDKGREHDHVAIDDTVTMISNAREGTNLREHHRKHYVAVTRAKKSVYMGPLSPLIKLAQDLPRLAESAEGKDLEAIENLKLPKVGKDGSVNQNDNPIWFPSGDGLSIPYYEVFGLTYGSNKQQDEDGEGAPTTSGRRRGAATSTTPARTPRGPAVRNTEADSGLRFETPEGAPALDLSPEYTKPLFAKSAQALVAEAGRMRDSEGNPLPDVGENLMSMMFDSMTGVHQANNKDRIYDPRQIFDAIVLHNKRTMKAQAALDNARMAVAGLLDSIRGDNVNSEAVKKVATTKSATKTTREPKKISNDPGIKVLRDREAALERQIESNPNNTNAKLDLDLIRADIEARKQEIVDGVAVTDTKIQALTNEAKLKPALDKLLEKNKKSTTPKAAPASPKLPVEDTERGLATDVKTADDEIAALEGKLEKLKAVRRDEAKMAKMTQQQRTRLSSLIMEAEQEITRLEGDRRVYQARLDKLRRLAAEGDTADELVDEEEDKAQRESTSAISPDTMAEIFDRYALMAEYRKAIAQGKISVPLEYSTGGVSNRYNAPISEVLEALMLAGFTEEEINS